jgi:hypothetical protein
LKLFPIDQSLHLAGFFGTAAKLRKRDSLLVHSAQKNIGKIAKILLPFFQFLFLYQALRPRPLLLPKR